MDYKKAILSKLLDKYENSKAYLDMGSSRRVLLKLFSKEFPDYDVEKSENKEIINSVVQELKAQDLVGFEWYKFERGNIIDKVWLKLENVDLAYKEIGRQPKSNRATAILKMVQEIKGNISLPWIRKYLSDAEENVEINKSATPFLPDDEKGAQAVLKALKAINDKNEEEFLERVFSLKTFGDSKFFERRVRKRVVGIIKNYLLIDCNNVIPSDDEILSQIGIVKAPEQVDFCGGIIAKLAGDCVDFSPFRHGIAINSDTVKEIEFFDLKEVRKVLFIENKANYLDYISKGKNGNELVIFHGGFYSPVKGLFFKKVYEIGYQAGIPFYHWGDIDIGGFRIFNRLKTNIIPGLNPVLMDKAAFLSRKQYWIRFDDKYGSILEEMLGKEEFFVFHDVIFTMLEARAKLEQEAFL